MPYPNRRQKATVKSLEKANKKNWKHIKYTGVFIKEVTLKEEHDIGKYEDVTTPNGKRKRGPKQKPIDDISPGQQLARIDKIAENEGTDRQGLLKAMSSIPLRDKKEVAKEEQQTRSAILMVYAKDKANISHDGYETFRQIGNLQQILPKREDVSDTQVKMNTILNEKWGLYSNFPNSVVLGKVKEALVSFLKNQRRLHDELAKVEMPKIFHFKLTGDGRQFKVGNVGYGLQPLTGIGVQTQSSKEFIPVLVYTGADNREDLEKYGREIKEFFQSHLDKDGKMNIDGVDCCFSYNGDMSNDWHTCGYEIIVVSDSEATGTGTAELVSGDLLNEILRKAGTNAVVKSMRTGLGDSSGSINKKCIHCGLTLQDIRHKKGLEQRVTLTSCLGVPVRGFCILHCNVRIVEHIQGLYCGGNVSKIRKLEQRLHAKGCVRESWGFEEVNGQYKAKQLFGEETEKILDQRPEKLFPNDQKAQELIKCYKILKNYIFGTSSFWENVDRKSAIEAMENFKKALIATEAYGNEGETFYTHLVGDHLLEIVESLAGVGLSLPMLSQQGAEQANAVFKNIIKRRTSSASVTYGKTQLLQYMDLLLRIKIMEWDEVVPTYRRKVYKARKKKKSTSEVKIESSDEE